MNFAIANADEVVEQRRQSGGSTQICSDDLTDCSNNDQKHSQPAELLVPRLDSHRSWVAIGHVTNRPTSSASPKRHAVSEQKQNADQAQDQSGSTPPARRQHEYPLVLATYHLQALPSQSSSMQ
jgi:hypothetical protein